MLTAAFGSGYASVRTQEYIPPVMGCHKLKLENGKVCLMQQVGRSRQLEKLDKSQVGCPGIKKTEQLLFLMSHLVRGTVCQAQCHLDLSFE